MVDAYSSATGHGVRLLLHAPEALSDPSPEALSDPSPEAHSDPSPRRILTHPPGSVILTRRVRISVVPLRPPPLRLVILSAAKNPRISPPPPQPPPSPRPARRPAPTHARSFPIAHAHKRPFDQIVGSRRHGKNQRDGQNSLGMAHRNQPGVGQRNRVVQIDRIRDPGDEPYRTMLQKAPPGEHPANIS